MQSNANSICTSTQQHPTGKPSNFDINKHLAQFENANEALLDYPVRDLVTRSAIMASMFAPGRKYDLKANPNYMASQEFGNWFYGAAAAQMGFSEQEALTAGAVVQQWQNYNNTNHPDAGDVSKLASNIYTALTTGQGDNSDDAAPISGGHSYSTDVYDNDPNRDTNADSCNPDTPNTTNTSSGGGGYGGGWYGGLWGGFGGCYGCNVPSGTVIIYPSQPDENESPSPEEDPR